MYDKHQLLLRYSTARTLYAAETHCYLQLPLESCACRIISNMIGFVQLASMIYLKLLANISKPEDRADFRFPPPP
jgi:hypothetical protein